MNNKTIGVFFGGKNPEHDVSIITGQLIISELKKLKCNVMPIYIGKAGEWYIDKKLGALKFFVGMEKEEMLKSFEKYYIDLQNSRGKIVFKAKSIFSKKITIDIAFPAFHGENGEDGTIQGLFEFLNIPYIGCNVASSAIAIDKILTKMFYKSQCIPTTEFIFFKQDQWGKNKNNLLNKIKEELTWPIFVKPAKLGSSIGMTKVVNENELENACEVALHYGNKILIEESVENLADITCAILGNDNPKASLLQESLFTSDHFSYEDKYLNNGGVQFGNAQKNIIIPAELNKETTKQIQNLAIKIFKLFGCSGISRIDFLYDKSKNQIYANEVNTMPGTLYHHLWKKSGIDIGELIEKLIKLALAKNKEKQNISRIFRSDLLNQAKLIKLQINN